jgi:hypothetical protein
MRIYEIAHGRSSFRWVRLGPNALVRAESLERAIPGELARTLRLLVTEPDGDPRGALLPPIFNIRSRNSSTRRQQDCLRYR